MRSLARSLMGPSLRTTKFVIVAVVTSVAALVWLYTALIRAGDYDVFVAHVTSGQALRRRLEAGNAGKPAPTIVRLPPVTVRLVEATAMYERMRDLVYETLAGLDCHTGVQQVPIAPTVAMGEDRWVTLTMSVYCNYQWSGAAAAGA